MKQLGLSKKITRQNTETFIDNTTGEVLQRVTTETAKIDGEPDFVKLYIDDLIRLRNLPAGCNPLLNELLRYMNYKNEIILNAYLKENIAKVIDVSVNRVSHILADLVDNGVLTRVAKGTYLANPDLFGRGKWVNIRELRFSIRYDDSGRTFTLKRNNPEQTEMDFED